MFGKSQSRKLATVVLGAWAVLGPQGPLSAAEYYWKGAGVDNKWSTAANWSGTLTETDDVRFKQPSAQAANDTVVLDGQKTVAHFYGRASNDKTVDFTFIGEDAASGFTSTGTMYVGGYHGKTTINLGTGAYTAPKLEIGGCVYGDANNSGDNFLSVGDGAVLTVNGEALVGTGKAREGRLTVDGGTLSVSGDLKVAHQDFGSETPAELVVNAGTLTTTGTLYVGYATNAVFTLNGGTVRIAHENNGLSLHHGKGGRAVVNLNGGTLVASKIRTAYCTAITDSAINFNGTTVKATKSASDFLADAAGVVCTLGKGGLVVDTDGHDVTITHPLTGEGGIVKKGLGKLTLTGTNDFTGGIKVYGGSVVADGQTYVADEDKIVLDGTSGGDLGEVTILREKMGAWAADPAIFNYGSKYGVGGVATEELPLSVEVLAADGTTKIYRNLEIGASVQYGGEGDVFTTKALAPRTLEVAGHNGKLVKNVRDCGGWPLVGGGRSNQGRIYRGGHLDEFANATDAEKADNALVRLGLKTEIELRKDGVDLPSQYKPDDEIRTASFVNDGVGYVYCGIGWGNNGGSQIGADDNGNFTNQIHKVFATLGTPGRLPAYFHCRIGTDRTGIVGLLLQALCGATEETLYRDYLASNFANIESGRSPEVPETFLRYLYRGNCNNGKYVYSANAYGESAAARARAYLEMCGVTDEELSNITQAMTGETLDGVLARVNAYETAHGVRTVSFKEKEGASAIAMHRVAAGETPIEPLNTPTKEGYAFKGWDYADEAADGSVYPIWEQTEGPGRDKLSFRWDNDTDTSRIADDGNWYVHETNPKERDEVTIIDSAESDGTFQYLDEGDVFEVKDVIFGRNSSNPSVVDISNGTMRVANLLNLGRYGQSTVFNVFGGSVEAKALAVGNWGSHNRNTMTISGGEVLVRGGNWPGALTLGLQTESRGELTVSGGTLTALNTVNVGFSNLASGSQPGPSADYCSRVTVDGGLFAVTGNVEVANADGDGIGGGGYVKVNGGLFDITGDLNIAASKESWAQVDVTGGRLAVSGNVRVGNNETAGHALLNVTGGEVDCGELSVARKCSADLIVKDATVRAKIINKSQSAPAEAVPTAYLDNATIVFKQSYGYNFSSFEKIEVGAGGVTFDTDGHTVSIQAFPAMTGVGGLTKNGEGLLEIVANSFGFAGDFKLRGDIVVNAGTLKLPEKQTLYVTGTHVAEGATLDLNGSTVVLVDKKLVQSTWTNAAGDGDATNGANWETVVMFCACETGAELPELTETLNVVPGAETTVRLPYELPRPTNLDPATVGKVTVVATDAEAISFVIDYGASYDDYRSVGSLTAAGTRVKIANSLNGLLKSAYAWYDPSDAATLTLSETGLVTRVANKGHLGAAMDAVAVSTSNAPQVSTEEYRQNGLDMLVFRDNHGFEAAPKTDALTATQPRALFAVSARQIIDAGKDPQTFAIELSDDTMWSDPPNGRTAIHQLPWGDWADELTAPILNDEGAFKGFQNMAGFWGNGEGRVNVFGLTARATEATAQNRYVNDSGVLEANVKTTTYQSLVATPGCKVRYGRRNQWNSGSKGRLGEALAFVDELSDEALVAVDDYLAVKWLGAEPQVTLSPTVLADLALEGATVDFDGAPVELGLVTGTGTLAGFDTLKIAELFAGAGQAVAVDGAVDLTGLKVSFDEAYLLSLKGNAKVTLLTADAIGGFAKLILVSSDGTRRFVVRVEKTSAGQAVVLSPIAPFVFVIR